MHYFRVGIWQLVLNGTLVFVCEIIGFEEYFNCRRLLSSMEKLTLNLMIDLREALGEALSQKKLACLPTPFEVVTADLLLEQEPALCIFLQEMGKALLCLSSTVQAIPSKSNI